MNEGEGFFWRWGLWLCRHGRWVIAAWVALFLLLRVTAPPWDEITYDGDVAYLPQDMPSVLGQRLLREAFGQQFAPSEIVLVIARRDAPLAEPDLMVAYDLARRMKLLHAQASLHRLKKLLAGNSQDFPPHRATPESLRETLAEQAEQACNEAAYFDNALYEYQRAGAGVPVAPPLPEIYHLLADLYECLGRSQEAEQERRRARAVQETLPTSTLPPSATDAPTQDWPLLDVWTWREPNLGSKLISADRQARMIVLRLTTEFMAVRNQPLLAKVAHELDLVRSTLSSDQREYLTLQWAGSAAIGGDLLKAAKESISHTEWYTVVLILLILAMVYRAPLMVAIPLLSIGLSVAIATDLVALLAVPGDRPWTASDWGLRVFTTTRIFIVVILFGGGTDYCLFLIARYREELARWPDRAAAMAAAMQGVGSALLASACTTIVGLAMMGFADFGKFRYSGPVIGVCLGVTLLVCLSLAPAILHLLGPILFWPWLPHSERQVGTTTRPSAKLWSHVGQCVTRRPATILLCSIVPLLPLVSYGWHSVDRVTYDLLADLHPLRPSRLGTAVMWQHFPIGEAGALTVIVHRPGTDFASVEGRKAIAELAREFYAVPGVHVVRSLVDPLGDFPPGQRIGVVDPGAWRTWLTRPHRKTLSLFVSDTPEYPHDVTRWDVILDVQPFSLDALNVLREIDSRIRRLAAQPDSGWYQCRWAYTGPVAAMADLRHVTLQDRHRIEVLVVLGVLAVLLVILGRPITCLYLMLSVLFTYYLTIGITEAVFRVAYGAQYQGLDWKLPLFLFVILIAVGQDYNVYLVTRVWEEQRRRGPFAGLRYALTQTGGIITSCGVIMAGTFLAMTAGDWGVWLGSWFPQWIEPARMGGPRGIVELGFALTVGVLLDTLFVRTVLVPAFLALRSRWWAA